MVAVLFLSVMFAFGEILEVIWKRGMMDNVIVMKTHDDHMEQGQLCGHKITAKGSFVSFYTLFMIYVDDTVIPFTSRTQLENDLRLIHTLSLQDLDFKYILVNIQRLIEKQERLL